MTSGLSQENSFYHHHDVPRVKLYVSREESFPFPLKCIDVTRTTFSSLDVLLEKQNVLKITGTCVDGERELSDAWTGFTIFFWNERPPDGYTWCVLRLTRKQSTSRPDDI